jgi:hypothetical protein
MVVVTVAGIVTAIVTVTVTGIRAVVVAVTGIGTVVVAVTGIGTVVVAVAGIGTVVVTVTGVGTVVVPLTVRTTSSFAVICNSVHAIVFHGSCVVTQVGDLFFSCRLAVTGIYCRLFGKGLRFPWKHLWLLGGFQLAGIASRRHHAAIAGRDTSDGAALFTGAHHDIVGGSRGEPGNINMDR